MRRWNVQRRRWVARDGDADRDGNHDTNPNRNAQPNTESDGDGQAPADGDSRADRYPAAGPDEHAGSELADAGAEYTNVTPFAEPVGDKR